MIPVYKLEHIFITGEPSLLRLSDSLDKLDIFALFVRLKEGLTDDHPAELWLWIVSLDIHDELVLILTGVEFGVARLLVIGVDQSDVCELITCERMLCVKIVDSIPTVN